MDMAAAESGSTPTAASDGPVYLIMGVCGTGKTSLAQELALRLALQDPKAWPKAWSSVWLWAKPW